MADIISVMKEAIYFSDGLDSVMWVFTNNHNSTTNNKKKNQPKKP